jgi:hypothetical protein
MVWGKRKTRAIITSVLTHGTFRAAGLILNGEAHEMPPRLETGQLEILGNLPDLLIGSARCLPNCFFLAVSLGFFIETAPAVPEPLLREPSILHRRSLRC